MQLVHYLLAKHQDGIDENQSQIAVEQSAVILAYAIIHPGAVVVESRYTFVAYGAMVGV